MKSNALTSTNIEADCKELQFDYDNSFMHQLLILLFMLQS